MNTLYLKRIILGKFDTILTNQECLVMMIGLLRNEIVLYKVIKWSYIDGKKELLCF